MKRLLFVPLCSFLLCCLLSSCKKGSSGNGQQPPPPVAFVLKWERIDIFSGSTTYFNIQRMPQIRFGFSAPVNRATTGTGIQFVTKTGSTVGFTLSYENNDSTLVIQPSAPLDYITKYRVTLTTDLKSTGGRSMSSPYSMSFVTKIDSSRKFPVISDNALLDLVQQQTFRYFWDFAHPVSGLARERNTSGNLVTIGGSGFGVMSIVAAIHRGFITRAQGLSRLQTIVGFLKNTAQDFHGAFPHWMDGTTGAVIPFSTKDNGGDLVETSFLIQGLLTARQFFNGADPAETALRNDINSIWHAVEWDWYRQNGQNVLYWHWSPNYNWEMNHQIKGWNEALITYVLAASSPTHSIPKIVYDNGWASNGGMRNGSSYYGYTLPLGPNLGGPLFFEHYSFLGINPFSLSDAYANYQTQTKNHTLINYEYCKANPKGYFGYSDSTWGLTASDIEGSYSASSPTNDLGVIAPTAAISSIPYTPTESMKALKFFYYVLGDKLWGEYGFKDAFNLHDPWFASSYLAIDQGPIIVMIENYRSQLLWNLFTSCPEIKTGMLALGFTAPYL